MATKDIAEVMQAQGGHWVGDGFPVRSIFSYQGDTDAISPFLLFDYAGPHTFAPAHRPRGVGQHPHRGFETVTIVYEGEVSHRDSTGAGGTIGPGDVQWMTAAGGIIHEEFHSPAFTSSGGQFRVVQLWVNLPAAHKMDRPHYQGLTRDAIPVVDLPDGAGRVRVVAGDFAGVHGPARTFSPVNVWDLALKGGSDVTLNFPEGHTAMIAVLSGRVRVNDARDVGEARIVRFDRAGTQVTLRSEADALVLALSGQPLGDPVVGYGPFVMTSQAEIHQAIDDFNSGRFTQAG
jgi:redox-sensitive bicupin YhaK (pirin superfamily)